MRLFVIFLTIFVLLGNCAEDTNTNDSDANTFKWYEYHPDGYIIYSDSGTSGVNIIQHQGVQLPFFETFSPAAKRLFQLDPNEVDMWPDEGWVLLQKQFGSPNRAPQMPYFILYNKYRGVLRFFFYNARVTSDFSYAIVRLSHGTTPTATFAFDDIKYCALDNYNQERSLIAMCEIAYRSWSFVDFTMSYDPAVANMNDAMFWFTITGVHESEITLDGSITLNQVLGDGQLSADGSSFGLNEGIKAVKDAKKTYDSMSKLVKALKKKAESSTDSWYLPIVDEAMPFLNFLPYASAAGGAIKTIIGLVKPKKPVMINFKGDISLSGTIKEDNPTFVCGLAVPGMNSISNISSGSSEYFPFINKALGVFSIVKRPIMKVINYDYSKCKTYYKEYVTTKIALDPIDILVNKDSDVVVRSITYSLVWNPDEIKAYNSKYSNNNLTTFWGNDGGRYGIVNKYTNMFIFYNQTFTIDHYPQSSFGAITYSYEVASNQVGYTQAYSPESSQEVVLNTIFVRPCDTCEYASDIDMGFIRDENGDFFHAYSTCSMSNPCHNQRWLKDSFIVDGDGNKDPYHEQNAFLPEIVLKIVIYPKNTNGASFDNDVIIYKKITPSYEIINQY